MIIFIFTTISRKRGAYAIALRLRLYCIKLKSSFLLTAAYIYGKKHMKTKAWLTLLTLFFHTLLSFGCAVTPEPISEYDHWTKAIADKDRLYENQPPLTEPITLSMAIARALTYNYDHRLAMMEGVFQSEEMVVANLGMLPKLTASAGYTTRNNDSASRSISYFTRQQTLEPSISQERQRTIADLSFNWSILDFGISYFQAKQYADRYLIMEERRRRVSNNIVKDVVTAYWQMALSEMLLPKVTAAQKEAEQALATYRTARENGLEPILESLENEKRLLRLSNSLKLVSADLAQSKIQLAALINIPMDEPFAIVIPDEALYRNPPPLPADITAIENIGLYLRPDLREDSYQERIDKNEVNKEIIRMIPLASITGGTNYDSNIYTYHNVWTEATARVSSNLLGLPANYYQYKSANTQVETGQTKHLANMVAALVQIRLAYHQYSLALDDYQDNLELSKLEEQIHQVANSGSEFGDISKLEQVNRHTDLIAAQLQEFNSISTICEAWGNLYFSIGGDIAVDIPKDASLDEKAKILKLRLASWWGGHLPEPPPAPVAAAEATAEAGPATTNTQEAVEPNEQRAEQPHEQAPKQASGASNELENEAAQTQTAHDQTAQSIVN